MAFISGGIGDLISILSHCPAFEPLLLGTARAGEISELCYHLGIPCRTLECHRQFIFRCQAESVHGPIPDDDWSISVVFPKILSGEWTFQRKLFAGLKLPRVIQEPYVLVSPASMNPAPGRDMSLGEYDHIIANTDKKIVVANKGLHKVPKHARIIDLSNATSMIQSLALVRHADSFVGIDSWLAIAACQEDYPVLIKSVNPSWWHNRTVYTDPCGQNVTSRTWLV